LKISQLPQVHGDTRQGGQKEGSGIIAVLEELKTVERNLEDFRHHWNWQKMN
jgi:hypothetical protein